MYEYGNSNLRGIDGGPLRNEGGHIIGNEGGMPTVNEGGMPLGSGELLGEAYLSQRGPSAASHNESLGANVFGASSIPFDKIAGTLAIVGVSAAALLGIAKVLGYGIDQYIEKSNEAKIAKYPPTAVIMGRDHKFYAASNPNVKEAIISASLDCHNKSGNCKTAVIIDERKAQCIGIAAKFPFTGTYVIEKFDDVKQETLSKRLVEERKKPSPEFVRASYFCNTSELQAGVAPLAAFGTYKGPYKTIDSVLSVFNNVDRQGYPKNVYKNGICVNVTDIPNGDMFKVSVNNSGKPISGYAPQYQLRPAPECK